MIKRSREVLSTYFLIVLCLLAIGLPNLNLLMSIGSILLLLGWLYTRDFKYKFSKFFNSTPALLMTGVFFLHFLFLINTSNFDYAWHDIRIKLPLLILPLVLSSLPPLSKKQLYFIFYSFIAACLFATFRVYINYYGHFDPVLGDPRTLVKGVSHVRLSLMMVFAIGIVLRLSIEFKNWSAKIGALVIAANFLFFLNLIRSATGLILVILLLVYFFFWYSYHQNSIKLRIATLLIFIGASVAGTIFLNNYYNNYYKVQEEIKEDDIPEFAQVENGNYVWKDYNPIELKSGWNERSDIKFDGSDSDFYLQAKVARYMTSINLSKDREGVGRLTEWDIENIENGICSVAHLNMGGLELRLNKLMFEWHIYKIGGDPSGNSLTQRFEHWRAALELIKEKPVFGYGTGDLREVFVQQYSQMDTQLHPDYWFQSHNQYLTFFVAFGILGFILFLATIIFPILSPYYRSYYFVLFMIIIGLSCLAEDTLETQAGVTLLTFFYGVFINYSPNRLGKE